MCIRDSPQGTQSLAQALLLGDELVVNEPPCGLALQGCAKLRQELPDLVGVFEAVLGPGTAGALSNHYRYPCCLERLEGVLIGYVVTDIEGNEVGAGKVQRLHEPCLLYTSPSPRD